jgi:hypothetical protein
VPRKKFLRYSLRVVTAIVLVIFGSTLPWWLPPFWRALSSNLVTFAPMWQAVGELSQAIIFLASLVYARLLYVETRNTASRTNTMDHIFKEHTDTTVGLQRTLYRSVRDDGDDRLENYNELKDHEQRMAEKWKPPLKPKDFTGTENEWRALAWKNFWEIEEERWRETKAAILAVANRYETFAIGIQEGAIDERMYKRWWRATLVRDWRALQPFVEHMQKKAPNAYIEFGVLAEKWHEEMRAEERAARRAHQDL